MKFDKKWKLEKKLALMNAEFALILKCGSESMSKSYKWYCVRKSVFHLINVIGFIVVGLFAPDLIIKYIENYIYGG